MNSTPERILGRMMLVISGRASDRKRASLRRYLERHPDSKEEFDRLSTSIGSPSSSDVQRESSMRRDVDPGTLRRSSLVGSDARPALRSAARVRFIRTALIFIVGAGMGIIGYHIIEPKRPMEASETSGSFFSTADAVAGTVVDFDTVNVPGAFGVIRTRRDGSNCIVEANIIASEKTKLTFGYEPSELSYEGLRAFQDKSSELTTDPGHVVFYTREYGTYVLTFHAGNVPPSEIEVTVCHPDACLYHSTLSFSKPIAEQIIPR